MSELAIIDAETGELVRTPSTLFGTDDPRQSLLKAKEHADVLADVVKERQLYKVIGPKAHVFVEAWTMLGSWLGVFPVLDGEVEPVEVDGIVGFRATVKAVTRQGEVVGRATGYCMRDEPTWAKRPLHALAAMAETRATSRALRKPLGFIVQLAGYSPTAAEEMPPGAAGADREQPPAPTPPQSPPGRDEAETVPGEEDLPEALKASPTDPISDAQRARLWTIKTNKEMPVEALRDIVVKLTGQDSTRKILRRDYQAVSAAFEAWEPELESPDEPDRVPADKETRIRLTHLFRSRGFTSTGERLAFAQFMLPRPVETSADLTQDEAEFLATFLEARPAVEPEPA